MKPRISNTDLCRAANRVGTGVAEIKTFLAVETRNKGFDDLGRPLILFERHWFHKFTKGRFDASHPNISNKIPGGYGSSSQQYDRFSIAFGLDANAAMKSASWGLGQVMGFNYAVAGFANVGEFVDAMKESEGRQLDAAIEFIIHNGLDDELRRHDWRGFARGYNGNGYEKNDYHNKLAKFYRQFSQGAQIDCDALNLDLSNAEIDQLTDGIGTISTAEDPAGSIGNPTSEPTNEAPSTVELPAAGDAGPDRLGDAGSASPGPVGDSADAQPRGFLNVEDWKNWVVSKLKWIWGFGVPANVAQTFGFVTAAVKDPSNWQVYAIIGGVLFVVIAAVGLILTAILLGILWWNRKEIGHYITEQWRAQTDPNRYNFGLKFEKK